MIVHNIGCSIHAPSDGLSEITRRHERLPVIRDVILARPRGFCAGVIRAIETVEQLVAAATRPVYVRHQIVHNADVVGDFERRGVSFIEDLNDVPVGMPLVLSAHGVSRKVRGAALRRRLEVIDATCPLVAKVHREIRAHVRAGRHVLLIGHRGHPEVEGSLGQVAADRITLVDPSDTDFALPTITGPVAYATQTTLDVEQTRALIARLQQVFPEIVGPGLQDICYATTNRKAAVRFLARHCDLVLVVGSANSSNAARLVEVAVNAGVKAQLVDGQPHRWRGAWREARRIGVTAAASAPESAVIACVGALARELGAIRIRSMGEEEAIRFPPPAGLPCPPGP